MTTEYAARSALDQVSGSVGSDLRVFVPEVDYQPDQSALLAGGGLLVEAFLAGVTASMHGTLDWWNNGTGEWISHRLTGTLNRLNQASNGSAPAVVRAVGQEAVTAVQSAAWAALAAIEDARSAGRPIGDVSTHVAQVRDAMVSVLLTRGMAERSAIRCAETVSQAAGALVGARSLD